VICPAVIQQEYRLAVRRQSSLSEVPLSIIDNRKMHSILKTSWFLEFADHEHFHLIPSELFVSLNTLQTNILLLLLLLLLLGTAAHFLPWPP